MTVRRYLSSEGEVKVKGRNPRPALSPLADQRFTRGVDALTAHSRKLRSLRAGTDLLVKETREATKTGTPPIIVALDRRPWLRLRQN